MTLRVLHLEPGAGSLDAIRRGELTVVSPKNEEAVRRSLRRICERVIGACEARLKKVAGVAKGGDGEARRAAVGMVRALWEEEVRIARALLRRVEEGEEVG